MKKHNIQLAILVAAIGMAAQSQAAILTETASVAATQTGSFDLDFAQFNTALGTLNTVDITLTPIVGDIGYTVDNTTGTAVNGLQVEVGIPKAKMVNSTLGLSASWSSSDDEVATITANPGENTGSLPFNSSDLTITPSSVIVGPAGFTGSGIYDLLVTGTSYSAAVSENPNDHFPQGFYADIGGSLLVTYSYTPVPESATTGWFAASAALGALVVTLRKKLSLAA